MENIIERKLKDLIEPICIEQGIFFNNISIDGKGNKKTIKVIVDTEMGITLHECTLLSKEINDLFYRKDVFQDNYRVEVSSPGIDKPLQSPFEYRRSIGKQLNITYNDDGLDKEVSGELTEYDGENIFLKLKKQIIKISIKQIKYAKIKLQW